MDKKRTPDLMVKASEISAWYASEKDATKEKTQFIENLGWLLSQTREGVAGCEYDPDHEAAVILFLSGRRRMVNIAADSWTEIVKDVTKSIR